MTLLTTLVDEMLMFATSRYPERHFSIHLADAVSLLLPHDVDGVAAHPVRSDDAGSVPVPLRYRGHPIVASPFIPDDIVRVETTRSTLSWSIIRYTGILSAGRFSRDT